MPEQPPFDEDFFQRIKNVHWMSEPEVYWLAGDGCPTIINGQITASTECGVYTSEDGVKWVGTSMDGPAGFNAFYGGGWMRESLEEKGRATWVMLGVFNDVHPKAKDATNIFGAIHAASTSSIDGGRTMSNRQEHDHRHTLDRLRRTGDKVQAIQQDAFNFHEDTFTSTDGRIWEPTRFHKEEASGGGGGKSARLLTAAPPVFTPGSSVNFITSNSLSSARPAASLASVGITPFAEPTGTVPGKKRVFIPGTSIKASGKIRKDGPYEGETVTMEISPYDFRKRYGGPKLSVFDGKGNRMGTTDCGLPRTYTVAYGHYVFCVGGETTDKPTRGAIAYTEDGKNWGTSYMNDNPVLVLAVGPRE